MLSWSFNCNSFSDCICSEGFLRFYSVESIIGWWNKVCLHPDNPDIFVYMFCGYSHTTNEPTTTKRYDKRIDAVLLAQRLHCDCPLTGHHVVIIKRMHIRSTRFSLGFHRSFVCFLK